MPAAGREWEGIAELDPLLAERVERYFSRLGDFLLSIADEEDASQLVKGCMGDVRSPSVCEELAKRLWQFAQKQAGAADRVVRGVVKAATCGPYKPLASKEAPEDVYLRAVNASPHLGLAVLEKAIKARKATAGRAEHEEAKRRKWALLLAGYIEEAGLPAVERVRAMGDPNAVWLRAFGARRGNTLKNRCRSWAPVREWMLATHGHAWPRDAGALLQYLEERHQGAPLGKTVPNSIMASIFLMEQVGQVPLESRLSKDSLLDGAIKSWSQQLEGESEPVKQAPLYTVAILLSAELTLMRLSAPAGLRFACFMLLIMIWGCLRCDDLQGISPESITLSQLGLKFILSRTKTSGPGKRVGQLQGFILRSISLSGYDWLAAGVNLLQTDDFKIPRDFLFLRLTDGWEVHSREFMDGEGVACHIRRTLAGLRAPRFQEGSWGLSKTVRLVPEALLGFWSGHSARHFLPSVAAATGVDSDKRDFLGRWAVARSAGQAYVLTARQVIHAIQAHVCAALLEGRPAPGYVEEELLVQAQAWATAHGYAGTPVATLHASLVWSSEGHWSLRGKYPAIKVDPAHLARATAPGDCLLRPAEEEPQAPYFVTVGRSGFRRLHLTHACAVRQERCVETIPLFSVDEDSADAICKLCAPKMKQGEASSESASSDAEGASEPAQSVA